MTCDGCEGEVRGFRYRCVSCPDFDLCGACETQGLHSEHKMMRLPKPHARVCIILDTFISYKLPIAGAARMSLLLF